MKKIILIIFCFYLSSCAGIFNPYEGEFACPKTYKGKCVSIQQAYEESLDPHFKEPENKEYRYELNKKIESSCTSGNCSQKSNSGVLRLEETTDSSTGSGIYHENLYRKMSGLLKEPTAPVIVPPKIIRVLILSYTGDSDLYMPRYVYFMADKPKWLLTDPFVGLEKEEN